MFTLPPAPERVQTVNHLNGIRSSAVLAIVLAQGIGTGAAQLSLKDIARSNGGKAFVMSHPLMPVTTLPEQVAQSDMIVLARILRVAGRLTADETRVVTEYELAPLTIYAQRVQVKSRVPTAPVPLLVQLPGGRVEVDGLELIYDVDGFPQPGLRVGDECFLFLQYDSQTAVYIPYNGPFRIFQVIDGRVTALKESVPERRRDLDTDVRLFTAEVRRLLAAK